MARPYLSARRRIAASTAQMSATQTSIARTSATLTSIALIACVLLAACAFGPPPPDQTGSSPRLPSPSASTTSGDPDGSGVTIDVIAKKLQAPWGVAFLPDGSGLVTERRSARILQVGPPAGPQGLTVTAAGTVPGVSATGDGGLLGIAVSPHYATDSTIFVYYSTSKDNRIASLRLGGKPHAIVTGIPRGSVSNGGGLAFGPDGLLYASTGDAGHASDSQNMHSLAGKILRMTASGKPAPGNPTPGSLVYAYGLHNVEGFAWDLGGHMYAADLGPHGEDDLIAIHAAKNYGWPTEAGTQVSKPILSWPSATSTCSGAAVVSNVLATACLAGAKLWLVQLTAGGGTFGAPVPALAGQFGRLRDVVTAPDGSLWITTSNTDGHGKPGPSDDQIVRVVISDAGAGKS